MLTREVFSRNTTGPVGESIMERLIRLENFWLSFLFTFLLLQRTPEFDAVARFRMSSFPALALRFT